MTEPKRTGGDADVGCFLIALIIYLAMTSCNNETDLDSLKQRVTVLEQKTATEARK